MAGRLAVLVHRLLQIVLVLVDLLVDLVHIHSETVFEATETEEH